MFEKKVFVFHKYLFANYGNHQMKKLAIFAMLLLLLLLLLFYFAFCFLGPYSWHVEVPRLWVKLELQLLVYTTAKATQDLRCICALHHNSQQCQIPTHWVRPGIKPTFSWILVRLISNEPQWELPLLCYFIYSYSLCCSWKSVIWKLQNMAWVVEYYNTFKIYTFY